PGRLRSARREPGGAGKDRQGRPLVHRRPGSHGAFCLPRRRDPVNVRKGLLALTAGSLLGSAAVADIHPNTAPGFAPGQSFSVGTIDNVNLFNGALTLNVPIGMSYPVNGGFSYSLKLIYNSSPWIFDTIIYQEPHDVTRLRARPTTCSNAGLGWRVSLGRFNPDCQTPDSDGSPLPLHTYQDESGADHVFYNTLHQGDTEDTLPSGVQ